MIEELIEKFNLSLDRDIALIEFDDVLSHSWLYSRFRPIVVAGNFIGVRSNNGKSYFVFESAGKGKNTKNRDKFFSNVEHLFNNLFLLDGETKGRNAVKAIQVLKSLRKL